MNRIVRTLIAVVMVSVLVRVVSEMNTTSLPVSNMATVEPLLMVRVSSAVFAEDLVPEHLASDTRVAWVSDGREADNQPLLVYETISDPTVKLTLKVEYARYWQFGLTPGQQEAVQQYFASYIVPAIDTPVHYTEVEALGLTVATEEREHGLVLLVYFDHSASAFNFGGNFTMYGDTLYVPHTLWDQIVAYAKNG